MTIKLTIWLVGSLIVSAIKGPDFIKWLIKINRENKQHLERVEREIHEAKRVSIAQNTELFKKFDSIVSEQQK